MKYKVISQNEIDERLFILEDEHGKRFQVDIYTDGAFTPPIGVDVTADSWREWLYTFVGKTLEIERLVPYTYFTGGKQTIVE